MIPVDTRLDYQPLFGKGARAPPPKKKKKKKGGGGERHERAAEIEPMLIQYYELLM